MRGAVTSQSPSAIIICDATGVPGGNRYTTFASANAARYAAGPGALLLINGDVTAEAQAHNFTDMQIAGLGGGVPTVTFPAGATATWDTSAAPVDLEMRNVAFAWGGDAVFIEMPASGLYVLMDLYSSISSVSPASAAFIHGASGTNLTMDVLLGCQVNGASGKPIVDLASGAAAQLFFDIRSVLASNTVTGGDAGAYTIVDQTAGLTATSALASVSHTQTGATTPTFDPP